MASLPLLPEIDLGPVCVADANMHSALQHAHALIEHGGNHYFCFCEASLFSNLVGDPDLALRLKTSDVIFPDGIALVALARIRGYKPTGRVSGPSFLLAAAEYGVNLGWRHFLYGGGAGVAGRLADRLQLDYPSIIIAGICSPPFRPLTEIEEMEIKTQIENARPDLLWVCLGSPKQELWCAEHVGRINVPLMLPVGAAFDFHSGNRPWAPAWVRQIGMEWAFRMFTGGKRTFFRNMRCVTVVGLYVLKMAMARLWNGCARDVGN